MQQQNIVALAVVILTISSCSDNAFAQQSSDRIVQIGELKPMADIGFDGVPRTAFLLTGTRLPDGVMFAISADYRSREPVRFQVWRPTDAYSTFTLVWEYRYESPVVGVRHDIYFYGKNDTLCYHFRRDDRVGVFIERSPAAIPYQFNSATRTIHTRQLNSFQIGNETFFDPLGFPYDFSVKAYVDTVDDQYVNDTSDWVPCPSSTIPRDLPSHGATGHTGQSGLTGATGSTGPKGDRGPAGPPGHPMNDSSVPSASGSDESTTMDIIELVWLSLLTIAVIVIIVVIIYLFCIKGRQKNEDYSDCEAEHPSHHTVSRKRSKSSSVVDDSIWFRDLKEETESTYSMHTIKETTPLSKTGPFVFDGPCGLEQTENNSQLFNGQAPADVVATVDVSSPATLY